MKSQGPLQKVIDPFVRALGGKLVSDLIDSKNPPPNADYIFHSRLHIIVELKALENDSFGPSHIQQVAHAMVKWRNQGRFMVMGARKIQTRDLPLDCQNELADILAKPVQRIISTANNQIEKTKELLKMPAAKGLLWIASDGNQDLQPDMVWFLLNRVLQKKHPDGRPQYSNINGLAYFNPRMLVELPDSKRATLFWFSGARDKTDEPVLDLLTRMCAAWPQYVSWAQGINVDSLKGEWTPANLKFLGVVPRVPRIDISKP